jgi:hypothetical protein
MEQYIGFFQLLDVVSTPNVDTDIEEDVEVEEGEEEIEAVEA